MPRKLISNYSDEQYNTYLAAMTAHLLARDLRSIRASWKNAERGQKRRCQQYGIPYTPIDYEAIFERDRWTCGICGHHVSESEASLDHITPLFHGGHHADDNVQCAHLQCNIQKWTNATA